MSKYANFRNAALSAAVALSMAAFPAVAHAQDALVVRTQQQLRADGYYNGPIDGIDGPETQAAIRHYQYQNDLAVNGQLDRQTCRRLGVFERTEAVPAPNGFATAPSSATVSAAQRRLVREGFYKGNLDGILGPETAAAIREYQKNSNLNITGQLDPATLNSLGVAK
ncbi:MAG TPA: peptidoglycan-binding protein [Bryobacteraceae bacterium]|jgi:peptidoglycan hydrolase-like protein with peptidoglycan-binding domain|nr:peptidoglycan-binding protein [Bryobacteraceae bacterium]